MCTCGTERCGSPSLDVAVSKDAVGRTSDLLTPTESHAAETVPLSVLTLVPTDTVQWRDSAAAAGVEQHGDVCDVVTLAGSGCDVCDVLTGSGDCALELCTVLSYTCVT